MNRLLFLLVFLACPALCRADLVMSPIFGDSMVLQRDQPIHIWGWTLPNQQVTAEVGGRRGVQWRMATVGLI